MLASPHNSPAIAQVHLRHLAAYQAVRLMTMWLVLMVMSLAITACGSQLAATATPEPVKLMATSSPEPTRLTALVVGKLEMVDGCLRLYERTNDISYLLAWPPDFTVNMETDSIRILKGNGEQVVLHIGEMVRIGGGEVKSAEYLSKQVQQKLPANCPGPYWVVGLEVSSVKATETPK